MDSIASIKNNVHNMIDSLSFLELTSLIKEHPCVRGMVSGYIAEMKFRETIAKNSNICYCYKPKDHDRTENKADLVCDYQGDTVSIQIKSIQTHSIKIKNGIYVASVQNDASDKRVIVLPNGEQINTTNYQIGEYDILAVPLFVFTNEWTFAYKLNQNCRKSKSSKYSSEQKKYLLATTENITYPLTNEWTTDFNSLIVSAVQTHSNR
jgi:hypothetical protein